LTGHRQNNLVFRPRGRE